MSVMTYFTIKNGCFNQRGSRFLYVQDVDQAFFTN